MVRRDDYGAQWNPGKDDDWYNSWNPSEDARFERELNGERAPRPEPEPPPPDDEDVEDIHLDDLIGWDNDFPVSLSDHSYHEVKVGDKFLVIHVYKENFYGEVTWNGEVSFKTRLFGRVHLWTPGIDAADILRMLTTEAIFFGYGK